MKKLVTKKFEIPAKRFYIPIKIDKMKTDKEILILLKNNLEYEGMCLSLNMLAYNGLITNREFHKGSDYLDNNIPLWCEFRWMFWWLDDTYYWWKKDNREKRIKWLSNEIEKLNMHEEYER